MVSKEQFVQCCCCVAKGWRASGAALGESGARVTDHLPFGLVVTHEGDAVVMAVAGEIDIATAPALAQALAELSATGASPHDGPVIVDLSEVTFMDSTGVNSLVKAKRDGIDVQLRSPGPLAARVIELTGLDRVVPVVK
jgi:anti-anti-sigma factor